MLHRVRTLATGILTVALLFPAAAGAQSVPDEWTVLPALDQAESVVRWNDLVVGGDDGGGLLLFDPATGDLEVFGTGQGLPSNRVRALTVDGRGRLWVGTVDVGAVIVDAAFVTRSKIEVADRFGAIRGLAFDAGTIFFGAAGGAGTFNSNGLFEREFTDDNGLPSNDVFDVAAFDGRAWFATGDGVGRFDRQANDVIAVNDGLPDPSGVASNTLHVAAGSAGVFASVGSTVVVLDEATPGALAWQTVTPGPGAPVLDLDVAGDTVAVLLSDNRVLSRASGATDWSEEFSDSSGDAAYVALDFGGAGEVWLGGRRRDPSQGRVIATPLLRRVDPPLSSAERKGMYGDQAWSLEPDGEGGVWIGAFPPNDGLTHWRADGSLQQYGREDNTSGAATEATGFLDGNKRAIERDLRGDLWVAASTGNPGGLTRFRPDVSGDPAAAEYLNFRVTDDVMKTRRILDVESDPTGRVWLTSDAGTINGLRNLGLDILVDPSAPELPASWLKIYNGNSRLLDNDVPAVTFQADGVAWIAVRGQGLQRWDVDGPFGGGTPATTANDLGAWATIDVLETRGGDEVELTQAVDVKVGADGRIWVATLDQGVFSFVWGDFGVDEERTVQFRTQDFGASLVSNQQRALAAAADGSVWSGGEGGVHRLRVVDDRAEIVARTDLASVLTFFDDPTSNQDIVAPVPSGSVRSLAYEPVRNALYVGTELGVARLQLGSDGDARSDAFSASLRPNPMRAGDRLVVTDFEGVVDAYVYTLNGRLVHTARDLRAVGGDDQVWDGKNIVDDVVVNGLYLVRLVRDDGAEIVRTVAVER